MDDWVLQFRWDERSPWMTFGLPHGEGEAKQRLIDVRDRMPKTEWRLLNLQTGDAYDA